MYYVTEFSTETHKAVPVCAQQQVAGESHSEGARRDEEVPQGVRHGTPRALVYPVQVEEGV